MYVKELEDVRDLEHDLSMIGALGPDKLPHRPSLYGPPYGLDRV